MSKIYKQISELGEIITGKTPSTANNELWGGDIPFITPTDIKSFDSYYQNETERSVSDVGAQKQIKTILPKNSVCVSCIATIGKMCLTRCKSITNQQINSIIPNKENDYRYILYMLRYNLPYIQLVGGGSGSGTPIISKNKFSRFKFLIEDNLPIQRRIASILSAYDNLIENSNKRIRLLEQMAENLYKEWFVRFRFPGHEKAEFENGLPKGWSVKRMADFCYVTDGTHDTPKPVEDGIPLITGKCISNGFIDFDVAYNISAKDHDNIKKRSGLSGGDILFSNIGTVGNCCIVDYHREFSVKNVIIFKPNDISKTAYLYYWMLSDSMQNVFSTQTNGASQQFVGLTFMRRYKILVPEQRILFAFGEKINPLVEQKKKLHRINQNLSRQRDLLLPRLMSGKLEVKV